MRSLYVLSIIALCSCLGADGRRGRGGGGSGGGGGLAAGNEGDPGEGEGEEPRDSGEPRDGDGEEIDGAEGGEGGAQGGQGGQGQGGEGEGGEGWGGGGQGPGGDDGAGGSGDIDDDQLQGWCTDLCSTWGRLCGQWPMEPDCQDACVDSSRQEVEFLGCVGALMSPSGCDAGGVFDCAGVPRGGEGEGEGPSPCEELCLLAEDACPGTAFAARCSEGCSPTLRQSPLFRECLAEAIRGGECDDARLMEICSEQMPGGS